MKLKDMRFRDVFSSRFKKLIVDMTSVKFEFVVFVGYCILDGKINPVLGLPAMMTAIGIREYSDYKEKKNGGTG